MSTKNLTKIVNIIETNVNNEERSISSSSDEIKPAKQTKIVTPEHHAKNKEDNRDSQQQQEQQQQQQQQSNQPQTGSRQSSGRRLPRRLPLDDDILFPEPTFSERFMRYFWIVVYLCGLCSLGFMLSIYHLFFWDSRMPPIYKPGALKKPIFPKPPGSTH